MSMETFNSRVQVHSDIATNDATFTDQVALVRVPFSVVGNSNVQLSLYLKEQAMLSDSHILLLDD